MKSKDKDTDVRVRIPAILYRRIAHAAIDAGGRAGKRAENAWILAAIEAALPPEKGEGGGEARP